MRKFATICIGLLTMLVLAQSASAALSDVPTPTVLGPIPVTKSSHPFLATDIDLDEYGYEEKEYFIEGDDAHAYNTAGAADVTGTPVTTGGPNGDGAYPYKTRIVVRRPKDPSDFNGVVVAEWYNVTTQYDLEANWFGDPEYMLKHGYAFVGISAQNVGITALKAFDASRYGSLNVNGNGAVSADGLSYDIYDAAIKAVKGYGVGPDPMGPLQPEMVIASGESQSCGRLVSQYNKVEPIHEIIDAYLLTVCSTALRSDRPEKVIRVITETENRSQQTESDTDTLRHWEVAGGSHIPLLARRNWTGPVERDRGAQAVDCVKPPLSKVQWPFVQNAAIDGLIRWSRDGEEPAIAPRGEYSSPSSLIRDDLGIAQGAIRLPEMTVPTGVNTGTNSAAPGASGLSVFCSLLGSYEQFDEQTLSGLYADYGDFVDRSSVAADDVVSQGFVLPEDGERLKADARAFPALRPTAPALEGQAPNTGSFGLAWRGTEAPASTFEVQRQSGAANAGWEAAGTTTGSTAFEASDSPEGTYTFRVRSSTVIPETNIEPEYTVVTPWSEASVPVKVDRSGPEAPAISTDRIPDADGWFRDSVKVSFEGRPDVALKDGTPGVGLDSGSVPAPRTVAANGSADVTGNTADLLGNRSADAKLSVKVDAGDPRITVNCPAVVKKGAKAWAKVIASDQESGLASSPPAKVRIKTKAKGRRTTVARVADKVGHTATASCTTRVKAAKPAKGKKGQKKSGKKGKKKTRK